MRVKEARFVGQTDQGDAAAGGRHKQVGRPARRLALVGIAEPFVVLGLDLRRHFGGPLPNDRFGLVPVGTGFQNEDLVPELVANDHVGAERPGRYRVGRDLGVHFGQCVGEIFRLCGEGKSAKREEN